MGGAFNSLTELFCSTGFRGVWFGLKHYQTQAGVEHVVQRQSMDLYDERNVKTPSFETLDTRESTKNILIYCAAATPHSAQSFGEHPIYLSPKHKLAC